MRFLAALSVAAHHTLGRLDFNAYGATAARNHTNLGSLGVAIFFVLSGFLIAHTIIRKRTKYENYDFTVYFVERACRIYLVFLPGLLLSALLVFLLAPHELDTPAGSMERWLVNLFMLSGVTGFSQTQETFLHMGPSWTLNYEMFFYVLFGLLMLPLSGRFYFNAVKIVLLFATAWAAVQLQYFGIYAAIWAGGALMAVLHQALPPLRPRFCLAAGGAALAAYLILTSGLSLSNHAMFSLTTFVFSVLFLMMIWAVARGETSPRLKRLTSRLAGYSYSLYVTHPLALWLVTVRFDAAEHALIGLGGKEFALLAILCYMNLFAYVFARLTEDHTERVRAWALSRRGGKRS